MREVKEILAVKVTANHVLKVRIPMEMGLWAFNVSKKDIDMDGKPPDDLTNIVPVTFNYWALAYPSFPMSGIEMYQIEL